MNHIYLDHAATTPMHPEVLQAMLPYFTEQFGNPSSIHAWGRQAQFAIGQARELIAARLKCAPHEIVFTSGGTESNHIAIKGSLQATRVHTSSLHVITTEIEHHAILMPMKQLRQDGIEVTFVSVDSYGLVDVEEIQRAIRPDTVLISVMYGNNEVGTLQPLVEVSQLAKERGILFHVDAVQALGKCSIDLTQLCVDMMSFSAHKINGPKGMGALYISQQTSISPLFVGGSQEKKRRAGTEHVAGIIGFAKAVELSMTQLSAYIDHMNQLRECFFEELHRHMAPTDYVFNGHPTKRLPHIVNISFPGISSETLLMNLDLAGVAISSGSACSSGSVEASHVLQAMHIPQEVMNSAVRFSFGFQNTREEIIEAVQKTSQIVERIRSQRIYSKL